MGGIGDTIVTMTPLDDVYLEIEWPQSREFQLVGLGLNAVDWICILPHFPLHNTKMQIEEFHQLGGGQVATASALCARYGLKVRYIGRVGDDDIGRFSLEDLKKEPMDVSNVDIVEGTFSQYAIILVDRLSGERTILWDRDPALHYGENELNRESVVSGQMLHLDGHDQPACIQAAQWARDSGMKISVDIDKVQPGVDRLLELTDFVLVSSNFVREFSGLKDWKDGLLKVSRVTRGLVGVTRGRQGSAIIWENEIIEVAGLPVDSVDSTGAGDIYHGGFIFGLFQGWSLGRCLQIANAAGALACTEYGARKGIPPLDDLLAKLE